MDLQDAQGNLRFLLNEWDPIGVADLVQDEYDCLIAPVLKRLMSGGGRAEVSELLWYELEDHFGVDPARSRGRSVGRPARRVVTCHQQRSMTQVP